MRNSVSLTMNSKDHKLVDKLMLDMTRDLRSNGLSMDQIRVELAKTDESYWIKKVEEENMKLITN